MAIKKLKTSYRKKIYRIKQQIKILQSEVSKYDSKLRRMQKKAEVLINNYKRLHEIQMKTLRKNLTLMYNPVFHSPTIINILNKKIPSIQIDFYRLRKYSNELEVDNVITKESFNQLRERIFDNYLLLKRLKKIPYKNSVKKSLEKMFLLNNHIVDTYENIWNKLLQLNKQRKIMIDKYEYAIHHLINEEFEGGYIIDPREPMNIFVVINPLLNVGGKTKGFVFRKSDEFIGTI